MSPKRTPQKWTAKHLPVVALGVLCVVSSFSLGIQTAGDIETIAPSEAGGIRLTGDINNDGQLTVRDAIDVLEVAQGYETATVEQLLADPNGDGHLTVEDAMRILQDLAAL